MASFTKAAAKELIGRDLPIDKQRCGTLHAHCFRALGNPKIAEANLDKFNEMNPGFFLSGGTVDNDEGEFDQRGGSEADKAMTEYQLYRAKRIPFDVWPFKLRHFAGLWTKFKERNAFVDFNDMIEICAKNPERVIPEGTKIGIFDETQDFTPLQLELVRGIGSRLESFLLAGDDDQTIYGFTGATPKAFLEPDIDAAQKKILGQSYRVPRAVQAAAESWINQIRDRQQKEYKPRDFEGEVRKLRFATSRNPDEIVERAMEEAKEGKTSMILASCGFMLNATVSKMRELGLPFHNPYKAKRGDWNPLGARKGVSTKDRLVMFLEPHGPQAGSARLWTLDELAGWVDLTEVKGILKRGAKKEIKDLAERQEQMTDAGLMKCYTEWFEPAGLNEAVEAKTSFIERKCVASKRKALAYPMTVIEKMGIQALRETPKICVGTIHSVKGGQADNVFLYPDLSNNAARELNNPEGRDSITRQFYVGMTRCKENLIIAAGVGEYAKLPVR